MTPTSSSSTGQSGRRPGELLKELRRVLAPPGESSLTQDRLGDLLALSSDYIYKLEAGHKPILIQHVDELTLLRPEPEERAREFDRLLAELRAAAVAREAAKPSSGAAAKGAGGASTPPVSGAKTKLDTIEGKLDALANTTNAKLEMVEEKLDHVEKQLEGAGGTLDKANLKLDVISSKLDKEEAKLDKVEHVINSKLDKEGAKLDKVEREVTRVLWIVTGGAALFAVGCIALAGALLMKRSADGHEYALASISETREMGPKVKDDPIPKEGVPNQKHAPCDPSAGESTFYGLCWFSSGAIKPPCGKLFRSGDTCYAPVTANPQSPVGIPTPTNPGPRADAP